MTNTTGWSCSAVKHRSFGSHELLKLQARSSAFRFWRIAPGCPVGASPGRARRWQEAVGRTEPTAYRNGADAEPVQFLRETRGGEMAASREVPFALTTAASIPHLFVLLGSISSDLVPRNAPSRRSRRGNTHVARLECVSSSGTYRARIQDNVQLSILFANELLIRLIGFGRVSPWKGGIFCQK